MGKSDGARGGAERVLLLTPTGRDASLTGKYLSSAGVAAEACGDVEELCEKLLAGDAEAAIVSEEALTGHALRCLIEAIVRQPPWSDFPLIVLTNSAGAAAPAGPNALALLGESANMALVERPTRVITLISAVRSALRARRRQYEVRANLEEQERGRVERTRLLEKAVAAQRQAEEANRAKDIFLATLSHELRTPLTAVLGWARMLRSAPLKGEALEHGLRVIERNAESQQQLIQDLLDVSRIITGKLRLDVRPVELAPVVEAAVDSVRQAAEAKDIRLGVELGEETALVAGDPDRLQQVIWNLLSNAIKFTPKEGRVDVTLGRRGSDVRVEVSDTGLGIAPEFLPHVFERFRQADGSTTRQHGGLGLGLAVVRHLVEQHGGAVSAESEGEGRGATFVVALPLTPVRAAPASSDARESDDDVQARPDAPQSPMTPGLLAGVRVLVVDDQPDARELVSLVLTHAGAEVTTAGSAAEALEAVGRADFDVLLSDIGMPGQDGYDLLTQVRALATRRGAGLRAAALTAYAAEEDRLRSSAAGYERHVTKPVEPSELVAVVAHLAGRGGDERAPAAAE